MGFHKLQCFEYLDNTILIKSSNEFSDHLSSVHRGKSITLGTKYP